jgi:hypothetical protein
LLSFFTIGKLVKVLTFIAPPSRLSTNSQLTGGLPEIVES